MKPIKMNSVSSLALLILAASISVTATHAQDMAKQGSTPKPARARRKPCSNSGMTSDAN